MKDKMSKYLDNGGGGAVIEQTGIVLEMPDTESLE
jgi:hypothetical protein